MKKSQNLFTAVCLVSVLISCSSVLAGDAEFISQIVVNRPAHKSSRAMAAIDERLNLDLRESIQFNVSLAAANGTIRLEAPNGGMINHKRGAVQIDASKNGPNVSIDFATGENPGRYTLEITRGSSTRTIEMWAGTVPLQGKPGPALTFTGRP
jgi:hypothetical protein